MTDNTFKNCVTCDRVMTKLDDHQECFRHRVCNVAFPCDVCKLWSAEKRATIDRMIEKARTKLVSATVTTESVPSVGNPPTLPTASSVGSIPVSSQHAPPAGMQFVQSPSQPPFVFHAPISSDWQKQQEALINRILDSRLRQMDSNNNDSGKSKRFNKFGPSQDRQSDDESDVQSVYDRGDVHRSPGSLVQDDVLDIDSRSQISGCSDRDNDSVLSLSQSAAKGNADFQNFMKKVADQLHIDVEHIASDTSEFKSYVSDRLVARSEKSTRSGLPMDGAILSALSEVDQEFKKRGSVKTYKSADDDRYLVTREHFDKFCSPPKLDDNVEEGSLNTGRKSASKKSTFRFKNNRLHARNNELWKIDQAARLLMRELSYSSMIVSYLDVVGSQEAKTEGLQALMSVVLSMADVTSRIIVGSVAARRSIHIEDLAFKNKATENKLLMQPTLGNKLFCGNYFDILHSSAENLRDAKETQHLIKQVSNRDASTESSNKRKGDHQNQSRDNQSYKRRKFNRSRDSGSQNSKTDRYSDSRRKGSNQNQSGFRPPSKFDIASSNEFNRKSSSHPGRVQINSICGQVERNYPGPMDFRRSPGRTAIKFSNSTSHVGNKGNVYPKQCTKSVFIRRGRKLVPQGQEGLGFYSTFFTVQKKGGGLRPILNLRPLNKYLKVQHFKMETLRSIIRAMEIGDWVAALDLKDAYLHIPIFPPHRKFLRFCIENQHFQFKAMPFGLATAPRVFTKVMAAVGGYLRMKEVHIFMYLDDWLLKSREPMLLVSHLDFTLRLLMDLGLVVNLEKSHIWPSQMITYLGAEFNLQKGIVCPTEDRFQNLCQAISILFQESFVPAKLFLRILGLMASCIDLVPLGRLHMRPIQLYLLCHWSPKKTVFFTLFRSRIHFYHTYSGGLRGATFSREHVSTRYVHRKQCGQMPPIRVGVLIWALRIFQGPGPQHRHRSTSMF